MKKVTLILTAIFILGVSNISNAMGGDDKEAKHVVKVKIPTVNLVDIENADGDNAGLATWEWDASIFGAEAGDFELDPLPVEETFYLQYTSIKAKGEKNKITAQLTASNIPAAMSLQVKVAKDTKAANKKGGTGEGNAAFTTIPSNESIPVVKQIKTCYTGTAAADGHALNYQLKIDPTHAKFGEMEAGAYDATITYTITAE